MATRYRKRAFLNKDRSKRAYVIAHVDAIEDWETRGVTRYNMGGTLEIGDCSKTIYLDFGISSAAEKSNVLYKTKLFRDIVNTFLDQVEAEAAKSDFKPVKLKKDGTTKKRRKEVERVVGPDGEVTVRPTDIVGVLAGDLSRRLL